MSVNARVVLLVKDDMTLCTQRLHSYQRKDRLSHYENPTSLSVFGSIFENFWRKPMSVNARVILLVGYDKTMYMTVTRVSTKR